MFEGVQLPMKINIRDRSQQFSALLALLALGAVLASGCGGQNADSSTEASNPQAANAAAKQAISSDAAQAQARAELKPVANSL